MSQHFHKYCRKESISTFSSSFAMKNVMITECLKIQVNNSIVQPFTIIVESQEILMILSKLYSSGTKKVCCLCLGNLWIWSHLLLMNTNIKDSWSNSAESHSLSCYTITEYQNSLHRRRKQVNIREEAVLSSPLLLLRSNLNFRYEEGNTPDLSRQTWSIITKRRHS